MLDFIGTIMLVAAVIVSIQALAGAMPISAARRIALSIGAGLWAGLAAALAGANMFLGSSTFGPPIIGAAVTLPLVIAAVSAALSPAVRATLLAMPMPFLIGLNVWRIGGGFFILLALQGRLDGPFPQSAGWGDVITGLAALPVAWLALRGASDRIVWVWNAFGMLDLVAAVALGIVSANGSPLQLIQVGEGSTAVQVLPWSLIPTVLVPMFLIVHAVIFAQLRARRAAGQRAGELASGVGAQPPIEPNR
jgi:hypothetical protein